MFIDVPGASLFALQHGNRSADAIIGVGGWIGNSELWAEPFALLSGRWSTIAYDHRGTGVSVSDRSSISLASLVDDVFAVMDACGVQRGVLAAESAGALTALTAALQHPERISHLIIVDGLYNSASGPDTVWEERLLNDYEQAISDFVRNCIPEPNSEHLIGWGIKMLMRATPEDAVALLRIGIGTDLVDHLGKIKQPTLVIHGNLDAIVPLASAGFLASTLPNAELKVIQDAGHVPTVTRPALVAEMISDFLESNSSS